MTISTLSLIFSFKVTRIFQLNCFLGNKGNIVSNINELEEYIFEYNPDIFIISDSWVNISIDDVEINFYD